MSKPLTNPIPQHKGSKFMFDSTTFTLLWGKLPTKEGQLWNGETHKGEKMQFAGNKYDPSQPTPYWGW